MRFCTSCGAQLPEGAAFCVQCGASVPTGAEAAPPTPVTPPAAFGSVVPPLPGAGQVAPPTPAPEGGPTDKKSRKALYLSSAAIVVVAAIVVAMLFVFDVFKSDNGSSSPEGAVAQLVNSTVATDPGKALAVLAPGEISGFQSLAKAAASPNVQAAVKKLESQMKDGSSSSDMLGMFGSQFSALSGISATDLQNARKAVSVKLSNVKYTTTSLADGIASVTIDDAALTVSADSSKIPADLKKKLQTIVRGSDVPSWVNDLLTGDTTVSHTWKLADYQQQIDKSGQKLDAIVVRQNGNWYVSLYGTIAQHIYEGEAHQREQNGDAPLDKPDWKLYANPPKAIVASSPEQVPANLAKAFNDKSMTEIFQNLPQGEVRALYPFVPLLQKAADGGSSSSDASSVSFTGVKATTTGTDGDLVHVLYTQGSVTAGGSTASVDNGCYTVSGDKKCISDLPDFAQTAAKVFGVDKGIPITLHKADGGYQLDPVGTYVGLVASALDHADGLVTAYEQFMTWFEKQMTAFSSSYGSSSGSSCYDASGNYTC